MATTCRPSSCRRRCASGPCGCARWSWCAGRGPGGRGGAECPGSSRSPPCRGHPPQGGDRLLPGHSAVPNALVAADLHLAADVRGNLTAKVTLDLEVRLEVVAERDELDIAEILHSQVRADARRHERLLGAGTADAVDVGERYLEPLIAGEVDAD